MTRKYTVIADQGQGGAKVRECRTLRTALAYVRKHRDEASFGIIRPNGEWYRWPSK